MALNIKDISKISAEDAVYLKSATGKLLSKLDLMLDSTALGGAKAIKEQKQLFGNSSLAEMMFKLTQLRIALESRADNSQVIVETPRVLPEGDAENPALSQADIALIEDFVNHLPKKN